jgi:integrase
MLNTQRPTILAGLAVDDQIWREACQQWLASKRRQNSTGSTARNYQTAWQQFFAWSQVEPWDVTPAHAERWAAHLASSLANSTVNLKLAALSSFYNYAHRKFDLVRRNPFAAVDRVKVTPYEKALYPTPSEARAILAAIDTGRPTGKRDLALFYTILVTCRRSAEILNLRWGDLRPTTAGDWAFNYRYKGGEVKRAVLQRRCYSTITDYLAAAGQLQAIGSDGLIFPLSNSYANRLLKGYAERAGVDRAKAHLHGLRHAGARLRVQQMRDRLGGVDYEEIMQLLGHSSLAVTQIYVQHAIGDPVDAGGQAAAEALLP